MLKSSCDICSIISKWWTDGKRSSVFFAPNNKIVSIGYGGGPLTKRWNMVIIPKLDVFDLMYTDTNVWMKWEKCIEQSNKTSKEPIVFFMHKNKYLYIVIRNRYFTYLESFFGNRNDVLSLKKSNICVMSFDMFTDWAINIKSVFKNE